MCYLFGNDYCPNHQKVYGGKEAHVCKNCVAGMCNDCCPEKCATCGEGLCRGCEPFGTCIEHRQET